MDEIVISKYHNISAGGTARKFPEKYEKMIWAPFGSFDPKSPKQSFFK